MKFISKDFRSIRDAEKYLNFLYNLHNKVELISFPMFSECGKYTFKVG